MPPHEPEAPNTAPDRNEPIFFLPTVIIGLAAVMLAVYAAQEIVIARDIEGDYLLAFAFLPARLFAADHLPGGMLPLLWTPVTYAFLHGSWTHLLFNTAWLVIFGTPVARRYGAVPTLIMFALFAAAGAFVFALVNSGDFAVLLGASGAISGLTGAAMRFVFQPVQFVRDPLTGQPVPAGRKLASLTQTMASSRPRAFILIWIGLNVFAPFAPAIFGAAVPNIAWEAHLGGFVAGLFAVPLFERRR